MPAVEPTRNLVVVHSRGMQGLDDWLTVQRLIAERAPDIEVRIATNHRPNPTTRRWQVRRPSLVFSPVALQEYRPQGGTIYAGRPKRDTDKGEEATRLAAAGLPVPRTIPFGPGLRLDESEWGPFVIAKPTIGGGGRGIRLLRTGEVARRHGDLSRRFGPMLVQQFVEHVVDRGQPGGYRVLTIFGRVLYAIYRSREPRRRTLEAIADDPEGVIAFNFNEEGSAERVRDLAYDEDVMALSEKIYPAYREAPVHGIDLVRETGTGRLYIMEINPSGRVWHISSSTADKLAPDFLAAIRGQFDAIGRTADALIEKVRAEAS